MCDEDAYARSLSRISVAQIVYAQAESMCEKNASAGKDTKGKQQRGPRLSSANNVSAQSAVVGSLADLLGSFIEGAGRRARARAEHAGRTKCSLTDVIASLERCKPRLYTRDLATYARIETVAFPRSVPDFPAPTESKKRTKPEIGNNAPEDVQLPPGGEPWMPPLPPAHTYVATPGVAANPTGGGASRADLAAQRRSVGQSLARLSAPVTLETTDNPYLKPPAIGAAETREDERAEVRDPPEPYVESSMTESNRSIVRTNTGESEAKRMRIERVMRESGGVTGVSAAIQGAAAAAQGKSKVEIK